MKIHDFVCFTVEEKKFALRLEQVERVIHAIEITPIPDATPLVLGIFNLHGKIILTLNIRKRLNLPPKEIDPSQTIIIAHTSKQTLAILVDRVEGVVSYLENDITLSPQILNGVHYIEGVVRLSDGILLIQNLEQFFTAQEEKMLEKCLFPQDKEFE